MSAPRRYLPSISALAAFEATARLGSATHAAEELSLTQGAISRQIRALEDQLGVALVAREGRSLKLTPQGARFAEEIGDILARLGQATMSLKANPDGGVINLAILPAFGMHWLAPRLPRFGASCPEVTVNLSTRLKPFDFASARFDAAIHFGRESWPGAHHMRLLPETVLAVSAPGLVAQNQTIEDHTLLHLETRPRAWARWFAAQGRPVPPGPGMQFDQFGTMAQAAAHGLGTALLPTFVAEPYLESGALVLAAPDRQDSVGTYFLVWPKSREVSPGFKKFLNWIQTEVKRKHSVSNESG